MRPSPAPASLLLPVLAVAVLASCSSPPASRGAPIRPGAVSVSWSDPAQFEEARDNPQESQAARQAWLSALARHLAERAAPRLPADQTLEVTITDVRRAGRYEPWRGPVAGQVRIVRDLYSPRITLEFRRLGASGQLLQGGRRELRDQAFLMRPHADTSDPAVYEKQLLDDWLDQEFPPTR